MRTRVRDGSARAELERAARHRRTPLAPVQRPEDSAAATRDLGAEALRGAAVAVAEQLCGRALMDGAFTEPAWYGQGALELRDLVPTVDEPTFDTRMGAVARAAWLVTVDETADHDEVAFADAACGAGLDRADFDLNDEGDAEFRFAVIEHWDLELRSAVGELVAAETGPVTDVRATGWSRPVSA